VTPRVVISPHLDDAVLSCSAQLGPETSVVSVFAGVPPEGTPLTDWDRLCGGTDPTAHVEARRAEDSAALAVYAAPHVHLDLLDGQYRANAGLTVDDVARAIRGATIGAAEMWLPAAIGQHPDHVLARDAALAVAASSGVPAIVYADLPYALAWGWPPFAQAADRDAEIARREADLHHALANAGWRAGTVTTTVHHLDVEQVARKLAASAHYRTQLPALNAEVSGRLTDPETIVDELSWRLGALSPV
jgi:LmbE family N-acetylglucosaminyl deacetylase